MLGFGSWFRVWSLGLGHYDGGIGILVWNMAGQGPWGLRRLIGILLRTCGLGTMFYGLWLKVWLWLRAMGAGAEEADWDFV